MTTIRRRTRNQQAGRITPEALAAFVAGDHATLKHALRLPPWQVSPLDAEEVCPYPPLTAGAVTWLDSLTLRNQLEAAA
ncbi:hypothetical protein ACFCQI_14260 [Rhodanobacter sp. FW102-FHT14D06]|uniref:Uncharacterized protein n=2 Tax=unclassified Rhodanobacter TaxID=2621553 RepID=A0AB74V053_9GAMM